MSNIELDTRVLEDLIARLGENADSWLNEVAHEILGDIVESFNTSPPGESYQWGGVTHVASQPGYPPNVNTGALRASMRVEKLGALRYQIMDGVEYGIMLEDGIGMDPRPFVKPVFNDWRRRILDAAQRGLIP